MAYSVSDNNITMTRGDTVKFLVTILGNDKEPYTPQEGDRIRFLCKKHLSDRNYIFEKEVPIATQYLTINPEDTDRLGYGRYYYDMKLYFVNGDVDTFIDNSVIDLVA